MKNAKFYHAGCTVCVAAEREFVGSLDPAQYTVEVIHLGESPDRVAEAEKAGVKSVPALVIGDLPFHINFGAAIADLK